MKRFLAAVLVAWHIEGYAADADVGIGTALPVRSVIEEPEHRDGWLGRYADAAEAEVSQLGVDRFAPRVVLAVWLESAIDGEQFEERLREKAAGAFGRALSDAGTDFALELAASDAVLEYSAQITERLFGWTGREQDVVIDDPSRGLHRRRWLQQLEDTGIDYGIRPFSTSPYAFVGFALRDGADDVVLRLRMRYHYRSFSEHRVEMLAHVPIGSSSFSVGYALSRDARDDDSDAGAVFRFERYIGGKKEFFVSAKVGEVDRVLAGFAMRF